MLLDEIDNMNFKKKYDFFYLPIDYRVIRKLYRIYAMLAMLLLISYTLNLSTSSISHFIISDGKSLTRKKYAKFVTREFKVLLNS